MIKTKQEAREYSLNFQRWSSQKNLSYGELLCFQNELSMIAKKFKLVREFKENGII
jgi:hypothetical protein